MLTGLFSEDQGGYLSISVTGSPVLQWLSPGGSLCALTTEHSVRVLPAPGPLTFGSPLSLLAKILLIL